MTSLVFVHGTRTRQEQAEAVAETLRQRLGQIGDLFVVTCDWGDTVGVDLDRRWVSLPPDEPDPNDPTGQWLQLYAYPLAELAELGSTGPDRRAKTIALVDAMRDMLRYLAEEDAVPPRTGGDPATAAANAARVVGRMSDIGKRSDMDLLDVFRKACAEVSNSKAFQKAANAAGNSFDALAAATARAVIATVLVRADGDGDGDGDGTRAALDARARDKSVEELVTAFGGRHLGLFGRISGRVSGPVDRWVLRRSRVKMAEFAADILLYQAHGGPIRDEVRADVDRAAKISTPVVLVGHSLGGVACFDALVESSLPQVELLVTVGSQAPFLYEVDALVSMKSREQLPDHMPRWLNIWDFRDPLAMRAEPVFGRHKVTDAKVNNGQPFLYAHSAYWKNDGVYDLLRNWLPGRVR